MVDGRIQDVNKDKKISRVFLERHPTHGTRYHLQVLQYGTRYNTYCITLLMMASVTIDAAVSQYLYNLQ
jgi:hypothetical protein